MFRIGCAAALALAFASPCSADELLAGWVQKVIQQPSGCSVAPILALVCKVFVTRKFP